MLTRIQIPSSVDTTPIPAEMATRIKSALGEIETFQDRWDCPQIEQFVAADYPLVYQCLNWTLKSQPLLGQRFLEWGSGFSIVSAIAAEIGLNAFGIEAEPDLLAMGRKTIQTWNVSVELVEGNFLPPGAAELSDDPMLPSLSHDVADAYEKIGLDLDDFALVYAYPWPGEDDFHEFVFDRYAASGALLMLFCGPNDVRLWRKTS
ncbi:class I SAM-dependent methyltransferase [Rhodopirellula sp.]|nr:class I SAM-dependent methyltransferase [Rubripirellula sp.]MDB4423049.1 class I SAM-dependent methyltransferase [Rhodopirellula sp.]